MRTATKLGIAGLGVYLVSRMLKKVSDAAPGFAPRGMEGYTPQMAGYDPLAEAIGCVNGSFEDQGLGSIFSKASKAVKKAVKKPVSLVKRDLKKGAAIAKRDLKKGSGMVVNDLRAGGALVKRDLLKAMQPLARDFRKGGKLMQTDFRRAGALFGGKKGKPSKQMQSTGGTIYLDENGNRITEAQYNALMARYQQEYGMSPGFVPDGAVQADAESPTFSMDQVAADLFAQQQNQPVTDGQPELDVLAYAQDYANQTGFADGTVPYTGNQLWEMPNGLNYDPLATLMLPEELQQDTFDVYGASQTSGDTLIMPDNEPSTPYTADELWIGYDDPDAAARGDDWTPEPSGHHYGNPQSEVAMPGYWQDYGGFDWEWQNEGLGDLVLKPFAHKNQSPAVLSMIRSQRKPTTYGWFMRSPDQRPVNFKADKKGTVYAMNGGRMHKVGPLTAFAHALGLGCDDFGRDMGMAGLGGFFDFLKKSEKVAKKVAAKTTPSGFAADYFSRHDPKHYRETTKALKVAKPYALIVGGTALSVVTVGAGSPAGAAMIAGGVASLGAQAYGDVSAHEAERILERNIERDRTEAALQSTDVINQTQRLQPSGGPAAGEIPGGDWPWEYAGDGVWADFLNLTDSFAG